MVAPGTVVGRRSGHVAELDGLRAFAILPVLLTHFWLYPTGYAFVNRLAATGWIGVDLFFVLSGYLITGILWDARESAGYYWKFYVRRVLRIFPLYYLLLLVVFALLPLLGKGPALTVVQRDRALYLGYLANVALVLHGWQLFPLDITWSLAIEEQFYVVWPLVVRRLSARALITTLACAIVLAPVLRSVALLQFHASWMATHMLTIFRVDSLAFGGLVAMILRQGLLSPAALRRLATFVLITLAPLLSVLAVTGTFARSSLLVGTVGYSLLGVTFAAFLVRALFPGPGMRLVLSHALLRRMGIVSYGMYILHPLCLMFLATALAAFGVELDALTASTFANAALKLVVCASFTYAVAELSYRVFERPILALKERFRAEGPQPQSPRCFLRWGATAR